MQIIATAIADIKIVRPVRHVDPRGFFAEIYREDALRKDGIETRFVQENHSLSRPPGVLRGLHFQIPPFAQAKLLRVGAGAIFDVVVDLRRGSASYGRHVAVRLDAAEGLQLFVPEGFAHGFCTLEPNTEVIYKVNRYYSAEHDRGLLWNDPALGIAWPVAEAAALLSDKDRHHPVLADLPQFFPLIVAIFGAGGQVGRDLCRAAWPEGSVLAPFDRAAVDITSPDAVAAAIAERRPDLVINLAAYTAVDRAESEPEAAYAVNCTGLMHIASGCARQAVPLIHLSTDYVFDGSKRGGYREDDPIHPLGVYGSSKAAGERAVREALQRHIILRTAWVYGAFGHNFVKTMLRLGAERPVLRVVADQHGCPTGAAQIAAALVALARRIAAGEEQWGTYHFAGAGATTWHGFAEAIFDLAAPALGRRPQVEPIATKEYPTPARRPRNSVLDCRRIAQKFGIVPAPWRTALAEVIGELLEPPR